MPITFKCPKCGKAYRVPDAVAGRSSKCKQCGVSIVIPSAGGPVAAVAVAVAQPAIDPAAAAAFMTMSESMEFQPSQPTQPSQPFQPSRRQPPPRNIVVRMTAACLGLGCMFLLVAGGAALWFFGAPPGFGASMKYLPDNPMLIVFIRMDETMNSDVLQEIRKDAPEFSQNLDKWEDLGTPLSNIDFILIGGDPRKNDDVKIIKTKKAITAEEVRPKFRKKFYEVLKSLPGGQVSDFKEVNVGQYVMHQRESAAFCVVDGKTLISGKDNLVRTILERDKDPELSEEMKAAVKQVDRSRTCTFIADVKAVLVKNKDPDNVNPFDVPKALENTSILVGQLNGKGDPRVDLTLFCKDAESAEEIHKLAEKGLAFLKEFPGLPPQAGETLATVKLETSGVLLKGNAQVKTATAATLLKGNIFGKVETKRFSEPAGVIGGESPKKEDAPKKKEGDR